MTERILLSRAGEQERTYRKDKARSEALISESKHFADEKKSDGPTTAMGHMRRYTREKANAVLAFMSTSANLITTIVVEDLKRIALEIENTINLSFLSHIAEQKPSLVATFTERVEVSDAVYNVLHEQVSAFREEFKLLAQRQQEAEDPEFVGPLTAEFEAYRQTHTYGPPTCQFDAYSRLKEQGIEYYPEEDVFVFPAEMIETLRSQFGEASESADPAASPDNGSHFVLIFKENAEIPAGLSSPTGFTLEFKSLQRFVGVPDAQPTPQ